MTTVALILLIIYIAINAFELYLESINYKHIKKNGSVIPSEFADAIDLNTLTKTVNYSTEKIRFGIFSSLFDEIILLIFIFAGILELYNNWLNSFNLNFILAGLCFIIFLTYAKTAVDLPFSIYNTFKIENMYGFNTMTFKLWLSDLFKSLIISTIFSALLLSCALWLIQQFPNFWWLTLWIFFFIFTMFMMYISPYVIEPLFNKFTPLDDEELENKIKSVLAEANIKISRVFKMDASKRTKHSNAYFTGFGHVKRIVLYDTLINSMTHDEIVAVLAHEAGHWKKKHIIKNLVLFELLSLLGAYIAFLAIKSDVLLTIFNLSASNHNGFFVKLILLSFIASIVSYPISPIFNIISRRFEREADDFACNLVGGGKDLASALIKLTKENLSNLHPHPFYAFFHYSHPPALERIKYLREHD